MSYKHIKTSILILLGTIVLLLVAGAFLFSGLEGWTFFEAFYYSAMVATTIGFGDYVPQTDLGKVFTIIYALSMVPMVLYAFAIIAKYNVETAYKKIFTIEKRQKNQEEELKKQKSSLKKTEKELGVVEEVVEDVIEEVIKDESIKK